MLTTVSDYAALTGKSPTDLQVQASEPDPMILRRLPDGSIYPPIALDGTGTPISTANTDYVSQLGQ